MQEVNTGKIVQYSIMKTTPRVPLMFIKVEKIEHGISLYGILFIAFYFFFFFFIIIMGLNLRYRSIHSRVMQEVNAGKILHNFIMKASPRVLLMFIKVKKIEHEISHCYIHFVSGT